MIAIGIDLGTTNSAAAHAAPEAKVLPTRGGEQLTPSVVGYVLRRKTKTGEIVVGSQAVSNAARDPENTVFSIKRLMGRTYGESHVEDVQQHLHYRLAEPPDPEDTDQGIRVLLNNQPMTPVEVSAEILRQVKEDAELALGRKVTHAVVTVPAYFEERQRQATIAAGEKAGLKVLEVLDEPTAAALAFGMGKEEEKHRVLVYDLGGGTFDISIIQMTGGQYEQLKTHGNNWLGGDDFDDAIVRRMVKWVDDEYGYDPSADAAFLSKAKIAARKAKIALSTQQAVEILDTVFNVPTVGEVDIELEITREDFEEDVRPLVDETIDLIHEALASQEMGPDDISTVLLVGGSTAVPLVQERVADVFGANKVKRNVNPMECVAMGAAIRAASFKLEDDGTASEGEGPRLGQTTAMDLGVAAVVGNDPDVFVPIIPRETPFPLSQPITKVFYPSRENQRLIRVPVYEGVSKVASLNEQQGVIEYPLPEGIPSTSPVEVAFNYDQSRVVTVGIKVVGTNHEFKDTLRRDRPRRVQRQQGESLLDDWRDELQPIVRTSQYFLDNYREYISEGDPEELRKAICDAETALAESNEIEGRRLNSLLQNKIMGSGTASQLFLGERIMVDAPTDDQSRLAEVMQQLKTAHHSGQPTEVERLSDQLSTMVAKVYGRRAAVEKVEDKPNYKDLLRFNF